MSKKRFKLVIGDMSDYVTTETYSDYLDELLVLFEVFEPVYGDSMFIVCTKNNKENVKC